jgi:hypothetical protein
VSREASLGVRLLRDLRDIFGGADRLSTADILERLHGIEEAPWAELRGRPLDARGLAFRLGQYEIGSTKVKVDGRALQGYRREDLWDSWERYAPAPSGTAEPPEPVEPSSVQDIDAVPSTAPVPEPIPGTEPDAA